ncbi:MAG: transglutaminase-like domain-containing protein [Clostridia bacterium]|nr:transglutaminase-like domain-containing protein [Clostridia bacterium]
MTRKSKIIYIVGSIAIGVAAVLIIFLALIASGVIDVKQRVLVIASASADFDYDGEEHSCADWSLVSGSLKDGHSAFVTVTGRQREIGSSENYLSAVIVDKNGADVTSGYKIEYRAGTLTVHGTGITIITKSAEKVYDGTPLYSPEDSWTLSAATPLTEGHEISAVVMNSSQTDAGSCANAVSDIRITSSDGKDVTGRYEISYVTGTLKVLPVHITIETASAQKVYDGTPLKADGYDIVSPEGLLKGHTATAVTSATLTDVGVKDNFVAEFKVRDANGRDVSSNYEVNYVLGKLLVTPRKITVRSASDSKDYDGKPLVNSGYEITSITKPLEGHTLKAAVTGSRTDPGESYNTVSEVLVTDRRGFDVSFNYEFNLELGSLVVRGNEYSTGGSLNPDGDIGGGPSLGDGSANSRVALSVKSSKGGRLYFRFKSFGDCDGRKWGEAQRYGGTLGGLSLNYLTSFYLENAGFSAADLSVRLNSNDYLLPYYTGTGSYNYTTQSSDVTYIGAEREYSLEYLQYNYLSNSLPQSGLGELSSAENEYRAFVNSRYLNVPESTKHCLDDIIAKQGFSASDPQIVKKVASYISNAAKYNLKYASSLDSSNDIVVAFLTQYKEGVCRHYASAAALLFRRIGIPARYTIGYTASVQANEWTDVTSDQAHAWVEVYIAGVGWVQAEVTGSSSGGDGNGDVITEKLYEVKPVTEYYLYDGVTAFTHSGRVQGIQELLDAGYSYEAAVSGSRRDLGFAECEIVSFRLFDSNGADVTDMFIDKIQFVTGRLQVYIKELYITTQSLTRVYDGTPLTAAECSCTGSLLSGHKVAKLNAVGSRTNVGTGVNDFEISITDASGADVTYMYKLNAEYGALTVLPLEITVTSRSKVFEFTADAVYCKEYDITAGELAAGHKAEVEINAAQKGVGRRDNVISSVKIYDANGVDVTANYAVTTAFGTLTVLPPQ